MRIVSTWLVLAAMLGGCARVDQLVEAGREVLEQPGGGVTATEDADAGGAVPGDAQGSFGCDGSTLDAVDTAVGGQLDAFASGDFGEALRFATPSFRASLDPGSFEAMIRRQFPIPATATDHVVIGCEEEDDVAVAVVDVTGAAGAQRLRYLLQRVDGSWLIAGAEPDEPAAAGDAEVI